jgi:dTDP-4-dehydrorhamnose reductase
MRTLITGARGMLGRDLVAACALRGHDVYPAGHAELDVTDGEACEEVVAEVRPKTVINCAAWTDVDGAEEHEDEALRVNRDGARNVAEAAGAVVYVSTDYVFDGAKGEPYVESDPVNPLSAYGRTKLAGERAIAAANPRHHIVRTSWLFGPSGANFVETILRLAGERDELRVVDDQVGKPTFTGHLAPALLELAASEDFGIHHRAGGGQCSWFEFASAIVEEAGLDCRVEPCPTAELPRPAPRPAFSALAGGDLPSWRRGLREYMGVRA